jgi:hypothetical protein
VAPSSRRATPAPAEVRDTPRDVTSSADPPRFVTVLVDEHAALPDGCCMRFKLAGEPREVRRVRYDAPEAPDATEWIVEGANAGGAPVPARAVPVEDSGAGFCVLVYGGEHGLRLRAATGQAGQATVAEPYLLLAPSAVLEQCTAVEIGSGRETENRGSTGRSEDRKP